MSWNKKEEKFLVEWYSIYSDVEMSEYLCKSKYSVLRKRKKLGLNLNKEMISKRISNSQRVQIGDKNPNWKGGVSKNNYHYKKIQKERYPDRVKAREKVYKALKSGKLIKESCKCGETKVQAHHEDYSKPLDVIWMCQDCHREHHKILSMH